MLPAIGSASYELESPLSTSTWHLNMTNLTARQEQVFNLIKRYIDDSGYPPTRADIAREFGFKSPNAAEEHLRSLQKKGVIEIIPGTSRGIRVNGDAGLPVYSLKNNSTTGPVCISHCEINPRFFSPKADCLVRLENQSFADLNLNKGDLLAVTKSNKAANQDLVIGELDDNFRLGILKKTRSKYLLKLLTGEKRTPEIEIDLKQQNWEIKGRVIGSIRNGL